MNEHIQSPLERYRTILRWLELPEFDSVEEGLEDVRNSNTKEISYFLVAAPLGTYLVYRAFWQKEQLGYQHDFTITLAELENVRQQVVIDLGEIAILEKVK